MDEHHLTINNTLAGVAQLVERVALITAKRSTSRSWVRAPPSAIPITSSSEQLFFFAFCMIVCICWIDTALEEGPDLYFFCFGTMRHEETTSNNHSLTQLAARCCHQQTIDKYVCFGIKVTLVIDRLHVSSRQLGKHAETRRSSLSVMMSNFMQAMRRMRL